jgi:hypothetical protein
MAYTITSLGRSASPPRMGIGVSRRLHADFLEVEEERRSQEQGSRSPCRA